MGHIPNERVDDVVHERDNVLPEQPRIEEYLDVLQWLHGVWQDIRENQQHIPAIQGRRYVWNPPYFNLPWDFSQPAFAQHRRENQRYIPAIQEQRFMWDFPYLNLPWDFPQPAVAQHRHENQRYIPAIQEQRYIWDPPNFNLPWDFPQPAVVQHHQPHFPREANLRPPPIGVSIPIIHRPYVASSEEFRISVGYRVRSFSLYRIVNRSFSNRRHGVRENITPPIMPQLRFQRHPRMKICISRLSPQRRQNINDQKLSSTTSPRSICVRKSSNDNHHLHGGRPQPFHLTTHRRLSRFLLRRCGCKMNRVDLEVTPDNDQEVFEEDEEEDDDDYKCNVCEAYKDLHCDNDSDDDDYNDDNTLPNMQLVC